MKQVQTFLLICIALVLGAHCVAQTAETVPGSTPPGAARPGDPPARQDIEKALQILQKVDLVQDPLEKKAFLQEAFELAKTSTSDSLVNAIIFQLSFNSNISGDWAKGFEWAMIGMNRISADTKSSFYPAFANMLAQSCEKQRDYPTALAWAQKAIQSGERNENLEYFKVNRWAARMIASKYMAILGYPLDSCLHYARESIRFGILDSINTDLFAYSIANMAVAFEAHQRPDSALDYFHRALAIFRETGNAFSAQETERDMARLFQQNHRPDSAHYYALKAYEAAPAMNNWDVRMDAAGILSSLYENSDKEQSLAYLKVYLHLKDSLFNRDKYNAIALIQTNEQLKARDAAEKERQLRNRIITYSLLAGLALMAFAGLFLYRSNQLRTKANRQLEQKNRELEIEAALEKVRTRTMEMHQSAELRDVITVFFEKMNELNLLLGTVGIALFEKETGHLRYWIGNAIQDPQLIYVPYDETMMQEENFVRDGWDAMTHNREIINKVYSRKQKDSYFNHLFSNNSLTAIPEQARQFLREMDRHTVCFFPNKHSALFADSWDERQYPEAHVAILRRAGQVFEQAYVRFLDLQKAEANAREAQIEAALERVRSSAMAMQRSDQLPGVVGLMYRQFEELQFGLYQVLVSIYDLDKGVIEWWSKGFGDDNLPQRNIIPIIDHPLPNQQLEAWRSGMEYRAYVLEGDIKSSWENYLFTQTDLRKFPEQVKAQMMGIDSVCLSDAFMKCGVLQAAGTHPLSEKQADILIRFARVLDQSYTRMTDLQKAESQAREAQVEAALEKVRSQSLAMQQSSELEQVAIALFDGLRGLGISMNGALIFVFNHEKKDINLWVATTQMSKPVNISLPYDEAYSENDVLQEFWKSAHDQGTGLNRIFPKEAQQEYFQYVYKYNAYKIPEEVVNIQQTSTWNFTYASEYHTMIGVDSWSGHLFTETQLNTLKSFSRVFEQAYIRFLDLQKAEYQAREAVKRSALERVRGEIASMRSQQDLDRITPLVWTELHNLGIRFSRCGIFIMDIPNHEVNIFLSSPDGKSIAAFDIDFRKINLQQVVEYWKKHEVFVTHWSQKEFTQLAVQLVHERIISNQSHYLDTLPDTGLYLHYIPFLQGMLYVAHTESLGQEELELVQSLADAFSAAYARYEDFVRLEEAKKEVDQTLLELKATQAQLIQSEKMASLGELTAGIAHEIQNPLNFVNNFSDLNKELIEELQEELKKGDVREASSIAENLKDNEDKINLHGRRADSIVKGMLQHSRSSTGQKDSTDINKLVDEYVRLAYHGYRARNKDFNVKLDIDLDPNLPLLPVVAQDIGRVLLNLLNNAYQAVEEKSKTAGADYQPTVSIRTQSGITHSQDQLNPEYANTLIRKSVLIRVADNGPGIPEAIRDKIFQPFFTTKPTGEGTGLGLSLSYDIMKAHGGSITLQQTEGQGTMFTLEIPSNL